MDILHSRALAIVLCAILIVAASFVGGGATLGALRGQTEAIFTLGDSDGMSIQGDLNEISAQAFNITRIAERYLPHDYAGIVSVRQQRDALGNAATIREKQRVTEELLVAVNMLTATLDSVEMSTQSQHLLSSCEREIGSRLTLIAASGYNQAAMSFNQALNRFPANILGRAAGVRPLELFE